MPTRLLGESRMCGRLHYHGWSLRKTAKWSDTLMPPRGRRDLPIVFRWKSPYTSHQVMPAAELVRCSTADSSRSYRRLAFMLSLEASHCQTKRAWLFMKNFGLEKVAHFRQVGFKFNKWVDVGYWERIL